MKGAESVGAVVMDLGLRTTPQLHWAVRAMNLGVDSSEEAYYVELAGAFKSLTEGHPPLGPDPLLVDCANGVGAPKLKKLNTHLLGAMMASSPLKRTGGALHPPLSVLSLSHSPSLSRKARAWRLRYGTAETEPSTRAADLTLSMSTRASHQNSGKGTRRGGTLLPLGAHSWQASCLRLTLSCPDVTGPLPSPPPPQLSPRSSCLIPPRPCPSFLSRHL